MKAQIESTSRITHVNGMPCRLWSGVTAAGVPFVAYIAVLRVERTEDQAQFEAELREVNPTAAIGDVIPLRFVI